MTKLLKEVLAKLSKLSPERQDELAAWLLAEMEDEARWDKSFAESQDALEKLADEALEEHKRGETRPLEEL
jgi:CRISPR/Cas system-associated protein Csm6